MRCASYAQCLRHNCQSVSVLWVALGHINFSGGAFRVGEQQPSRWPLLGQRRIGPPVFPCRTLASPPTALHQFSQALQNNQDFTTTHLRQTSPNRTSSTPLRFMQAECPHSQCLSLADRCMLFSSCGPLMSSLFCRRGWDWVALGLMCVLYLHIEVFWAEETDASPLLLRIIVLSSVYSWYRQRIG